MKRPLSEISSVPGWFPWVDRELFRYILEWQTKHDHKGDLLEIGCYMGKSAVVVGDALQKGESFTVVDLFEGEANDEMNAHEMKYSYSNLTQKKFENYYLSFHKKLPKIIAGFSSETIKHVKKSSCRFIHIDGSHAYNHVVKDIEDSKKLANKNGIVVCDDYRSEHTPGVAAAVWQANANGFKPICITPAKFYGTWGDPTKIQNDIRKWVDSVKDLRHITEDIAGYPVMRIYYAENPNKKTAEELAATKQLLETTRQMFERSQKQLTAIKNSKAHQVVSKAGSLYRKVKR